MSTEEDYFGFSHRCIHESTDKNEKWNAEYGGFDEPKWHFSSDENTLTFYGSGLSRVVCNVFIAGTTKGGRWQWSWGNRSGDEHNLRACEPVLRFGESRAWPQLTTAFQDADEYTGWEYASITAHIVEGSATYRFAYGELDDYMAYLIIVRTRKVNDEEHHA